MVFVNHFEHSLDSKGRIVLPAKFRHQLSERVFLVPQDGSLAVYSEPEYLAAAQRLQDAVRSKEIDPMVRRAFAMYTVEVEIDSAGRITIPQRLREQAQLTSEVVVNGALNYIEIWNRSTFESMQAQLEGLVVEELRAGGTIS